MIVLYRESLGRVENSVFLGLPHRRGTKSGFPMNREMERGWKAGNGPPTPQRFATSMDGKKCYCRALDTCPEPKAQGRAQGSRGQCVACACSSQHRSKGKEHWHRGWSSWAACREETPRGEHGGVSRAPQQMDEPWLRWG